jgi:hypothetical protein
MFIKASRTVTQRHQLNLTFLSDRPSCFEPAKSRRPGRLGGFRLLLRDLFHLGMAHVLRRLSYEAGVSVLLVTARAATYTLAREAPGTVHGGRLLERVRAIIANQAFDLVTTKEPKRI